MKLNQSTLFFIILAIALLATLGMNIKEGLSEQAGAVTRQRYRDESAKRTGAPNEGSNTISSIETGVTGTGSGNSSSNGNDDDDTYEKFWSERRGVRRVDIPEGDENLYVLKSSMVPPVCPKCPQRSACPRQKPCAPCPPCARCPEPAFTCKKVPNYNSMNNQYLPLPWLSQASLNSGNTW
jgi:hypothetical protein